MFESRYGSSPIHEDVGKILMDFRWMLGTFGEKKTKSLIRAYFRLDDKYLRERAYAPLLIRKNVNNIIASLGQGGDIYAEKYFVGYSESGEPIASKNPNILKGTDYYHEPVPWEEFEKNNLSAPTDSDPG
jgi:hypothetical protein